MSDLGMTKDEALEELKRICYYEDRIKLHALIVKLYDRIDDLENWCMLADVCVGCGGVAGYCDCFPEEDGEEE